MGRSRVSKLGPPERDEPVPHGTKARDICRPGGLRMIGQAVRLDAGRSGWRASGFNVHIAAAAASV